MKVNYAYLGAFLLIALVMLTIDPMHAFASAAGSGAGGQTLGEVIRNLIKGTKGVPSLIAVSSYLFGIFLGVLGILKIKEHVESPSHHPMWDGVKRILAGGAFLALPIVVSAIITTISGDGSATTSDSGFNGSSSSGGLDKMLVALMKDILAPSIWVIGWFGWIAGLIFVFIGISRLMKSEQEGPRGPTGIGTIMTFIIAGCLFSLNSMVAYVTTTLFGDSKMKTNGTLKYTDGLGDSAAHVHAVISAIIAFAIVIGWVSLVRGLFIVRGVSEGNSQASMMAAITHIIGGVLAINLGSVINAVQATLGITTYGITFN